MVSLPLSPKSASIQPLFTYFISMLTLFIFVSIQLIGLHVIQQRVNPQYLHYNIYRDITNGFVHIIYILRKMENTWWLSFWFLLPALKMSPKLASSITLLTLIYLRSLIKNTRLICKKYNLLIILLSLKYSK